MVTEPETLPATDAASAEQVAPFTPGVAATPRWVVLLLIFITLAVRTRVLLSLGGDLRDDPDSYRELAWHLFEDRTFEYWSLGSTNPTAYRPPLYPLVLSVFDYLPDQAASYGMLHVGLGLVTVLAVWRIGLLAGLSRAAALAAALLVAFDPILINQSVQVMNETMSAALAMVAVLMLARLVNEPGIARSLLAGAPCGLAILCRPTFLPWTVLVAAALPWVLPITRRRAWLLSLVFVLEAAAIVAPWAWRNWREFGEPIVTTTHGGYTLLLANNPQFYEYLRSGAWGSVWDASSFHQEWSNELRGTMHTEGTIIRPDELKADARAYELAFENIRREPAMLAYSCLVRMGRLWSIVPHQLGDDEQLARRLGRYAVGLWYTVELSVAAFGAWLVGRRWRRSPWLWCLLLALTFTSVHAFFWTDMRMRAPLAGVIALAAAAGGSWLVANTRSAKPLETAA
jgi:4-amino-4-deoxy-L-arabinose transferase-like glycosyltransferase